MDGKIARCNGTCELYTREQVSADMPGVNIFARSNGVMEVMEELDRRKYFDVVGGITEAVCIVWYHAVKTLFDDDDG